MHILTLINYAKFSKGSWKKCHDVGVFMSYRYFLNL